jgi:hypothetical protein
MLKTVTRERLDTKSGVCTKACIYEDISLEKIAKQIISFLKVPIFFNLQFMKNSKNVDVITDINFRLAGGCSMSYVAGWDEISALADIMLGKSTDEIFSHFKLKHKRQYVVRVYRDIITKEVDNDKEDYRT